ncbi:O-methyltransferase-domain-containing protein [Stachybotrys elegans]|uniref:O-methyltransferase-domain-containing protein n=1 Tax=Stachybotrys elegans TaxID=80388 RepID=A0A8K0WLZ3_9HYPO|nr:O-methyltransferase-domain-containing protein [Stachybotrys elegans]
MMSARTIGQLSECIAVLTKKLEEEMKGNNIKSPTLGDDNESFVDLSSVDQKAAMELAGLAGELQHLALGPRQSIGMMALSVHDASTLGVVAVFDIPRLVPLQGSATFAELSTKCGMDQDRLTRILRYAMINHVFREEPAGHVRHTAFSAHMAQNPHFCDFLRTIAMVFNPANTFLPIAIDRYPQTQSIHQAAHGLARQTDKTFYGWLHDNPGLRDNFDKGMEGISRGGQRMQDTDLKAYPWDSLPEGAVVVDMGGSGGHFARDLAETHVSFSVIVQDLPLVIQSVVKQDSFMQATNVTYQEHDLFNEQPVKDADVYFMRHVFHNHPDEECVKILKALLPALKAGARILISEYMVPPAEELENSMGTKAMRQMDLMTMALFNAKERTKAEMVDLFQRASPRLSFQGTHQIPEDPGSCIFEAVYRL